LDLSVDPGYYYGEIPQKAMRVLIQATEQTGWHQALEEFLSTFPPAEAEFHRRYVMLEARAAWKYLLHVPPDGVVLDIGCGWGATSLALARTFKTVVAMDMTLERLQFLQMRSLSEGFDNLAFYRGGDGQFLPFAGGTFDAVVVNGVLEWIPIGKSGDPRQVQIQFLREVGRILKPNGQLYLGIENRLGFKYFLGQVEDHTGVRFISLLPRKLADIYSRLVRREPFRNYTYTKGGLQCVLKEAGYKGTEFYIPTKDYREFGQISKADGNWRNPQGLVNNFKRRIWHWFQRSRFYPQICLAYSVVANKEYVASALIEDLLSGLVPTSTARQENGKVEISRYVVSGEDVVIVEANVGAMRVVTKIPLNEQAAQDVEMNYNRIGEWGGQLSAGLAALLPKPVKIIRHGPTIAYVESCLPGSSAQGYLWKRKTVDRITEQAITFLMGFQRELMPGIIAGSEFVRVFFAEHITFLEEFLVSQGLGEEFALVKDYTIQTLSAQELPVLPCHGDFWLGNVLVDDKYKISGIIDWGTSLKEGLPLIDLCEMICEGEHFKSGRPLAQVLDEYLSNPNHPHYEKMKTYLEVFRLSYDSIRPMVVLSWMLRASKRLPIWKRDLAFCLIEDQITKVFPMIVKFIHSQSENI
jgi:ubiquinone/menaquinone biosynthesis C-methylase UbiE